MTNDLPNKFAKNVCDETLKRDPPKYVRTDKVYEGGNSDLDLENRF